ncbi:MAG: tetratricopeptide repeat protein [Bacteroidota bacterium]
MTLHKKIFTFILLLCYFGSYAQNNVLFNRATEAYNSGDYEKAISYYQNIIENGQHSASLYFNLGNAYYKLDEIGPSIYYYEKALLLKPNDTETRNNLGYAQNMRLDAIEEMPKTALAKTYANTINLFSFDQWAYFAIALSILFVLAYLLYFFARSASQKRMAFISSILVLMLGIFAVCFAYLQYENHKKNNPAIIFASEVSVNSEPNERSEKIFTLHEGTKVNVLENLENWKKIKIADGQTGWLSSENLKLLKDF